MIDEHGPWLAGDFLAEYGIRLADAVLKWSPREVLALVEVLPDTSRFHAHSQGGDKWRDWHGWGWDRHIQANLYDLIGAAHWQKKPPTHSRPKSESQKSKQPTLRDFLRMAAPSKGEES